MTCVFCSGDGGELVWHDECLRVVLPAEPDYPGFTRVVWREHVVEMTDLSPADREEIKATAKEAGELQRKLFLDAETKFAAEFKANPKLQVNDADQAAFREASAKVYDAWKAKPFGDFVDRLAKATKG